MKVKSIGRIVLYISTAAIVLGVLYLIGMNIPYHHKGNGMEYYSSVKQDPSFKDKQALRNYCLNAGLNTNLCILVNYSIRSVSHVFLYMISISEKLSIAVDVHMVLAVVAPLLSQYLAIQMEVAVPH